MVRKVSYLFLVFILYSCCYTGIRSPNGLPRRKIHPLPMNTDYTLIDTMALYKIDYFYSRNGLTKEVSRHYKDIDNTYPYTSYFKFYAKGKVGLFIIPKKDTLHLERGLFNTEQAKMGYFYIDKNRIRISTIGDCNLYISNDKGSISKDTIDVINKNNIGIVHIRKEVPKELLEGWEPDW